MRWPAIALVAAILAPGCFTPTPAPFSEMVEHLPSAASLAPLRLAGPGEALGVRYDFGLHGNPGNSTPESIRGHDGSMPQAVYGAVYIDNATANQTVVALVLRFLDESMAARFLTYRLDCTDPIESHVFRKDDRYLTLLIGLGTGPDAERLPILAAAASDLEVRTGAVNPCPP